MIILFGSFSQEDSLMNLHKEVTSIIDTLGMECRWIVKDVELLLVFSVMNQNISELNKLKDFS